jgi:hypothetical protein
VQGVRWRSVYELGQKYVRLYGQVGERTLAGELNRNGGNIAGGSEFLIFR